MNRRVSYFEQSFTEIHGRRVQSEIIATIERHKARYVNQAFPTPLVEAFVPSYPRQATLVVS
jgi:hypothetical protein